MKRRKVCWVIESESDWDFYEARPTRKSCDRLAQKMANLTGQMYFYYTAKERRKAYKKRKLMKVWEVYPK